MSTSSLPAGPTIDSADVTPHLQDSSWLFVDCRFDLAKPGWGEAAYLEAHIPGAVYAHLDRDLSAPVTGRNGRHPLPDVAAMVTTMGHLGIEASTKVIVYDQGHGMYASRLWWMLRYLGHDAVAVLEGGFARWQQEGRMTARGREARPPRSFSAVVRPDMLVTTADVFRVLDQPGWRLVDARAPERFRGDVEPLDPVAGHIPGAVNAPWADNVSAEGRLRSAADLRAGFELLLAGTAPSHIVAYCGSGVSACHTLLAMEVAGIRGGRLYAGSWSEWCSDAGRPVARGA